MGDIMMITRLCAALAATSLLVSPLVAQQDSAKHQMTVEEFEASLHYLSGTVVLPGDIASLQLAPGFRFLDARDAARVLVAWGNPPGAKVLGIIVPPKMNAMSDSSWAVIVTFQNDGYVKDDDADKIDYDEMLQQMKKDATDENVQRAKDGYPTVEIVDWAEPPHYDR